LPAIAASVLHPRSVAVDAAGNLFIADTDHHRIRQVDASGAITTVAGTGNGFSGDGGPATSARLYSPSGVALDVHGNLLIADSGNDRVREVVR
jgi:sugar lactone lactonase YvrE